MLIAVSGKAGSGKDTVALMLSYFLHNDPLTYSFQNYNNYVYTHNKYIHDMSIEAFADKLKWMLSELLDVPSDDFNLRNFKQQKIDWLGNITVRELMQKFGTMMRNEFGDDIWCKTLLRNFNPVEEDLIISDLRYKSELEYLKKFDPVTIRIFREGVELSSHQSETDLDNYDKWDYVIKNNGSIEDLYSSVKHIFEKIFK